MLSLDYVVFYRPAPERRAGDDRVLSHAAQGRSTYATAAEALLGASALYQAIKRTY